jgi:hypothetical protein
MERKPRGPGLYLALVAAQTVGAAIILWDGMPIYREMMRDLTGHQPRPGVLWWAWGGILLVLGAYALRMRLRPALPKSGHPVVGHVLHFAGRLSFVTVTSAFSLVFINHFGELNLPPHRMISLLVCLFAMFCWNVELERLAKALIGREGEPAEAKEVRP